MDTSSITGARADISEMINKIRELSKTTNVFSEPTKATETHGFEDALSLAKNSMSEVNNMQTEAENLKSAYVSGDSKVSMSEVIVSSQKSKLAFEGLLAVRNKILEAYKEIMNMPV